MGAAASKKRVERSLRDSGDFNSACDSVYSHCLSLAQHAFPGLKPYQLLSATEQLHSTLSLSLPLISKWVPHPPTRDQVHRALEGSEIVLDAASFKEFAVEVFADAVVSGASRELLKRVPLGAAGIAGFGLVVKPGKGIVAAAIGAYALGVAANVYLGLSV